MTTESKACGNDLLYEAQNGIGIPAARMTFRDESSALFETALDIACFPTAWH